MLNNTTKEQLWKENNKISAQHFENVELKMAYLQRLHFLFILEKALTFLSDELDIFKM
jgi:hypothetical protein